MAVATGITVEEFEHLPDALSRNHELIDGELVKVSGNTEFHNALRELLARLLGNLVEERKLGKTLCEQEYQFDKHNVNGPDISFIAADNLHLRDRKRRVQPFVPDLAIEIVSENDKFSKLMKKAARFREGGTKEVWILSPDTREALVLSRERRALLTDDDMFESKLIPGFSIRLGELFDRA
jgi:Uma2 family endonuclease